MEFKFKDAVNFFNNNEIEARFNVAMYGEEFRNICDIYPIISAKKTEKSWWKIMKAHFDILLSDTRKEFKTTAATIKYCPGVYDFTNYGYIVPAWQDSQFWVNDDGQIEWQVPEPMQQINNIKIFDKNQIDTCPVLDNTASYILKLISPWFINTPKGTSLIMCKPFYHYSNDFDVCPGVLDSDIDREANKIINAFIRFNVKNKVIHIKAGQPLIQLIPFKRTNWKLKHVEIDKKFKDLVDNDGIKLVSRFSPNLTDKESLTKSRHDDTNKKFEQDYQLENKL